MANITPEQQKRFEEILNQIHLASDTRTSSQPIIDDLTELWEEIKSADSDQ